MKSTPYILLFILSFLTPAISSAQYVALHPSSNQTVNQPVNTTLGVNSLNSVINTDLNTGVAHTINNIAVGGVFSVPYNSTVDPTTNIPGLFDVANTSLSFIGHDDRPAFPADYYINPGSALTTTGSFFYGRNMVCGFGSYGATTDGSYECDHIVGVKIGGGVGADDQWTNTSIRRTDYTFGTRGQAYTHAEAINFLKLGDSIEREITDSFREGATGVNDEATKLTSEHLVELPAPYGTITTGGAGTQVLTANFTTNGGNQMDGGILVFEDESLDSGASIALSTAGSGAVPHLYVTNTTHAVSTWQAVLASSCGTLTIADAPANAACSVTVSVNTAAPTVGSTVSVDQPGYYEQAKVISVGAAFTATGSGTNLTASAVTGFILPGDTINGTGVTAGTTIVSQTSGVTGGAGVYVTSAATTSVAAPITATGSIELSLRYAHAMGVPIMFGGTAGGAINLNNGLSDPRTSPATMTAYSDGGSPDATHKYIVLNYLGNQQGEPFLPLPATHAMAISSMTCAAGLVTATLNSAIDPGLINPYLLGSAIVAVSGATALNGTVTNVQLPTSATNAPTWNAPGGTCGASSATGGTIQISGNQNFSEYVSAEVTALASGALYTANGYQAQYNPTGLLHLEANNATAATGERIIQPNHYATTAQMYTSGVSVDTQPIEGQNLHTELAVGGFGMSGEPVIQINTNNIVSNTFSQYLGYGGRINGNLMLNVNAPNIGLANLLYAPMWGASVLTVGCPMGFGTINPTCTSTQIDTLMLQANGYTTDGQIYFQGSTGNWFTSQPFTFAARINADLGVFTSNRGIIIQNDNGTPFQLATCESGSLYFCFGSNPFSGGAQDAGLELGVLQADVSATLPAATTIGGVAPCLANGTHCSGTLTPVASSVAPSGACTVAGTLEVTADGHGTYCKVGTLIWTTLY